MRYREAAPPPALAAVVQSLWEIRGDRRLEELLVQRVLPDGCFDLVLHRGDVPRAAHGGARAVVVGALLHAVPIELAGDVHVVGACLRPGGVRALLGAPARALTDRIVALDDLWERGAASFEDRVAGGDGDGALARLAAALSERRIAPTADALSARAVERIRRAGGAVSVEALADDLGVPRRRLERRFAEHVGLTPKQFCRVTRFDGVVRGPRGATWAARAVAHGYHDQAHLIHEFRALAGVTPLEFEREQREGAPVANGQDRGPLAR
jgi:AraC-like DNA-binding protein